MSRVWLVLLSLLLVACSRDAPRNAQFLALSPDLESGWLNRAEVLSPAGALLGAEDEYTTWSWKGVPFAQPPVAALRWKAPQPLPPWEGMLDSRDYGNACSQPSMSPLSASVEGHEDCLNLSIWRPQSAKKGLPVYIWVHGGGNAKGSGDQYPGARVANTAEAVYVSLQYRLGVLGWATHPALRQGKSLTDDSGNYGILDLISGIRWVKENIASFGGDPANITVGGTSAGAINVMSLALSPLAKDLFERAILVSPVILLNAVDTGEAAVDKLLQRLLVAEDKADDLETAGKVLAKLSPAQLRELLYQQSDETLLELSRGDSLADMWPSVYPDGEVIVAEGTQAFVDGTYPNPFPMIMGSSKEEMKFFMLMDPDMDSDDPVYQLLGEYSGFTWKASVDSLADAVVSHKNAPAVYVYRFDWGAPPAKGEGVLSEGWAARLGAAHSIAPQFFLGLARSGEGMYGTFLFDEENEPGREQLVARLLKYSAGYLHTGDPNGDGKTGPQWPRWRVDNRATLLVDATRSEARFRAEKVQVEPQQWLDQHSQALEPEARQRARELAPNYSLTAPLRTGAGID